MAHASATLHELHLLFIYDMCREAPGLGAAQQIAAAANFKSAAHYDIDQVHILVPGSKSLPVREAALQLLGLMELFFLQMTADAGEIIEYQRDKLTGKTARYAERVKKEFAGDYVKKGLEMIL